MAVEAMKRTTFNMNDQMKRLVCLAALVFAGSASWSEMIVAADGDTTPDSRSYMTAREKLLADSSDHKAISDAVLAEEEPWDFQPYRVLVWVVSDDPAVDAAAIQQPLTSYLSRDFKALWRTDVRDAPDSISALVQRDIGGLDFEKVTAADSVIAIKKSHDDAIRIRFAADLKSYVSKIDGTRSRVEAVRRSGPQADAEFSDVSKLFSPIDGDAVAVKALWSEEATEAILVSRGMAASLDNPTAKLISPPIKGLVVDAMESYDKIYLVRIDHSVVPGVVTSVEIDTLMRFFGPPVSEPFMPGQDLVQSAGRAVARSFAPVMRIDEAGTRYASGLIRGGGLIEDADSPGWIRIGDVLQPMVRKDDRNGRPISIGPIDWAYLLVLDADEEREKARQKKIERAKAKGEEVPEEPKPEKEIDRTRGGVVIEMSEIHAGRAGGLQGRKNNRTFRTAIKVRPVHDGTTLRLHAKGRPQDPLIGYEVYEKELDSRSMTFVGRTDWNGVMSIEKNDAPMRLFYVKNGGAVLARLPIVPGLIETEVADIEGDDMRLQAEAYIRGVQNAVIDLVAVRQLLSARIRMRIKKGQIKEADELLSALRDQPTHETLSNDMGTKLSQFKKAIGRNVNQQRKVDEMFSVTRELLTKHINASTMRQLDVEMMAAKNPKKAAKPEDK